MKSIRKHIKHEYFRNIKCIVSQADSIILKYQYFSNIANIYLKHS